MHSESHYRNADKLPLHRMVNSCACSFQVPPRSHCTQPTQTTLLDAKLSRWPHKEAEMPAPRVAGNPRRQDSKASGSISPSWPPTNVSQSSALGPPTLGWYSTLSKHGSLPQALRLTPTSQTWRIWTLSEDESLPFKTDSGFWCIHIFKKYWFKTCWPDKANIA